MNVIHNSKLINWMDVIVNPGHQEKFIHLFKETCYFRVRKHCWLPNFHDDTSKLNTTFADQLYYISGRKTSRRLKYMSPYVSITPPCRLGHLNFTPRPYASFTLAHFYHTFSASIRHILLACVNAPPEENFAQQLRMHATRRRQYILKK